MCRCGARPDLSGGALAGRSLFCRPLERAIVVGSPIDDCQAHCNVCKHWPKELLGVEGLIWAVAAGVALCTRLLITMHTARRRWLVMGVSGAFLATINNSVTAHDGRVKDR